jgi:hypothetical protein
VATNFPVFSGAQFSIVLLDECSQMIEPLSLLPISKFGAECLLAVGDPRQLPPTLNSVPSPTQDPNAIGTADDTTLNKTLFVRLVSLGFEPIMLRTQYRCHPSLSKVASSLFYENKLIDGVTANDRLPVVIPSSTTTESETEEETPENKDSGDSSEVVSKPSKNRALPALIFLDVNHGRQALDKSSDSETKENGEESSTSVGSFHNVEEQDVICRLVSILLQKGV